MYLRISCAMPFYRLRRVDAKAPLQSHRATKRKTGTWHRATCEAGCGTVPWAYPRKDKYDTCSAGKDKRDPALGGRTCRASRTSGSQARCRHTWIP